MVVLDMSERRCVTLCNHNYSKEGILHPDRVMDEYDLLFMQNGEWDIWEETLSEREASRKEASGKEALGKEANAGGARGQGNSRICYHLKPGSVLLLEPGKHHYSEEKCSEKMRNVYIHFARTAAENVDDARKGIRVETSTETPTEICAEMHAGMNEPPTLAVPKLVETAEHKDVLHCFERIVDAFWSTDADNRELRCSLYLEELLLRLSDLGQTSCAKTDVLVSEIIHRFHCEPEHFLSPQELADTYQVSVRTISGRFKQQTGMSLHQYQLQLKLNMAYDMLPISPGRSLHDIALSYGFYDEFQFSKLFKRQFGISPSERR